MNYLLCSQVFLFQQLFAVRTTLFATTPSIVKCMLAKECDSQKDCSMSFCSPVGLKGSGAKDIGKQTLQRTWEFGHIGKQTFLRTCNPGDIGMTVIKNPLTGASLVGDKNSEMGTILNCLR